MLGYRDIADTEAMIEAAGKYRHAVVIGAGLLGLEAANGLMLRGMDVTVVHIGDWIMERQLDKAAADMLQASLEAKGMKFLLARQTEALLPARNAQGEMGERVGAVRFKDGMEIPADLVVVAAGIRPNYALAESAGLYCGSGRVRGIHVSDTLQTVTDPRIYAVGECVAHRGVAYGLVAPLFEQGKVCANHLANFGIGRYEGSVTSTKLKVTGIDVFSAGDFSGGPGTEDIVLHDRQGGVYKRVVLKDDRIVGSVLYGDTADGSWYFQLMKDRQSVAEIRDHLMFGHHAAPARRRRPQGREPRRQHARHGRGVRLQRRVQGHHRQGDQGAGAVHPRRGQEAHQGRVVLRVLHRPGRADPRLHRRRRLPGGERQRQAGVRVYRAFAQGGARGDLQAPPDEQGGGVRHAELEDAERLRQVPAGGQLLPRSRRGRTRPRTTRSRASSTSARTPTSRRTAPTRWCRGCGAG